jgi:hypothetical protein
MMANWMSVYCQVIEWVECCAFLVGLGVIAGFEADDDRAQNQSRRLLDLFMYFHRIVAITVIACGFDGVDDPAESPGRKRV